MKALVLSGGGARGAYQAGVLTAIAEIVSKHNIQSPFQVYTGVSAGAINTAYMAAGAHEFALTAQRLASLWGNIHSEMVFKTDAVSLGKIGLSWMGELSFGGLTGGSHGKSLLDTSPLGDLIRNNINFSKIKENIEQGLLRSVAVTALDYKTSETITFVEGHQEVPHWKRSRRHSETTHLQADHIVASSAIPLLFTPGKVDERFFGDGCVRNLMPLSPALHLDASSLMVVGVRKVEQTAYEERVLRNNNAPSVARVVNVILNSVLLDGIEVDIERLNRINNFLKEIPDQYHNNLNFKTIHHVWIHPSEDIGLIAASMARKLPRVIRYLLKGLGPLEDASEIVSYLLFEPEFCSRLIEIGYKDAMVQQDAITEFLLRE
jgi:NTE family protein